MRLLICSAVLLLACGGEEAASTTAEQESAAKAPRAPTGMLATRDNASRTRSQWNRLDYHGGPLMMGPTNVYVIWYGQWTDSPVQPVILDLLAHLGGSQYFSAVATYANPEGGNVPANALIYSGAIEDSYSMGATLTRSDIMMVVSQAVAGGDLPADPDAVYLVLPSPDVNAVGLCESYCALHGPTSANGVSLKYAFIGNTSRCPSKCAVQNPGPNGTGPADAMASLIAAQLFDSVTDPELNAWYDQGGLEPAAKCAWTFGTTYEAANGAMANVHLGGRDYLLQQLWVNQSQPPRARGHCATSSVP